MPIINVTLIEGRPSEKKEGLIKELTEAAVRALDAPVQSVRVILNEVPAEHFGVAGVSKARSSSQSSS